MALQHSPSIVTKNLLLNLDFASPRRFTSSLGTNLVQDSTYNSSTWGTFSTIRTSGIDAPDGTSTAMRLTSKKKSCAYTLTSNVATVTMYAHGFSSGQNHYFDFTSGTGVDGYYNVTVVDANTFTIPVTAANGTGSVTVYGRTGLRVNFTSFTPNGTDTYTVSFWARLIRTSFINGGVAGCDLHDSSPSLNYTSQLVQNKWVQIAVSGVATATSKSFFDLLSDTWGDVVIDYWGLKIENQTTNTSTIPLDDSFSGLVFNLARPQYATLSDSAVTFTRTATTPKWGGNITAVATNSLSSNNFLYNDHTWEVWFKINDIAPAAYDAYEGYSTIAIYSGYHSGFIYTGSSLVYYMWDNTGPAGVNACSWTVGTSGAQVNQGSWYQIVVTRTGNVFTPYLNGNQIGTGSTRAYTAFSGVTNNIRLGSAANVAAGAGSYVYYAKNSISNMKMYNRALSAAEVDQNFNALRGRFAI